MTHIPHRYHLLNKGLRRKRGEMNATESRWAACLDVDQTVERYWFEPMTLRLSHPSSGQPATFTADFLVLRKDGVVCIDDVKSGGVDNEAAGVRIRAAAELFPLWVFRVVRPPKRKADNWTVTEV